MKKKFKYETAPFSSITGCGIFLADHTRFYVAIIPPLLPERLWEEAGTLDAVTRRRKYADEIQAETERMAGIVCAALNAESSRVSR